MTMQDHPAYRQHLIKENIMTNTIAADRQEERDTAVRLVTALYGDDPALPSVIESLDRSAAEDTDRDWTVALTMTGHGIADFVDDMEGTTVDENDPEDVDAHRAVKEVREPLDDLATLVSARLRRQIGDNPVLNLLLDQADEITAREKAKRLDQEAAQPE